ncbi:MAG: SIMPL domain-containing protein [Leucobacter sp.]
MTEITVSGAAEARVPADRAEVTAGVSARGEAREQVLQEANDAHARLVERAQELVAEGRATEYIAYPVSSSSNTWPDEHGTTVAEHHAFVNVRIILGELDQVSEIAADLTKNGADVGVTWSLSNPLRNEQTRALRSAAVNEAREAAEDYAAAIGASSLHMVSLRDSGQRGSVSPRGARLAMVADSAPEVTTGEITVSAQIEATFTAE